MTFRITEPGFYVNGRGEKVELKNTSNIWWPWMDIHCRTYDAEGNHLLTQVSELDIVGMWEKPDYEIPANPFVIGLDGKEQCIKSISDNEKKYGEHISPEFCTLNSDDDRFNLKGIDQHTSESIYDLTKISERFRALEDGRSINNNGSIYTKKDMHHYCGTLTSPLHVWSLVPLTRTVTTRLYVYLNHSETYYTIRRSEIPEVSDWQRSKCLGAIEDSELIEEVTYETT